MMVRAIQILAAVAAISPGLSLHAAKTLAAVQDKAIDGHTADSSRPPPAAATGRPRMLYGDATRNGRPFAKDPCVIRLGKRYLMYYSMAPSTNAVAPKGWAVGIAESRNLVAWKKIGEILPEQSCERNGLVNGKAILLRGKVHLFYNSYGNGKNDALCHAVSEDGLTFARDPSNPILSGTGPWNCGRAIDCDAFQHEGKLWIIYATRDPAMKTQMLAAATAPLDSDFGRSAWTHVGDGPILKPDLPWETKCIEAPSVIKRGGTLYLFYGGGYNNDPQQIGCAASKDGLCWTRLFRQPLWPNGGPGDWNASETGHPGVFEDTDGRAYLFVQGNRDKGKTWFLSCAELTWKDGRPAIQWDSPRFPTKRPGPIHATDKPGMHRDAIPTSKTGHWPAEKVSQWYQKQPWVVGCNFLPSTAINVGAINWGLVNGKSGTVWAWPGQMPMQQIVGRPNWSLEEIERTLGFDRPAPGQNYPEPKLWFHDILRVDGSPFDAKEVTFLKGITGARRQVGRGGGPSVIPSEE